MQLLALGLNHTTAPIAVRERVAFGPEEVGATIAHLIERFGAAPQGGIREAAVLSTCNRTELYCAVEDAQAARSSVLSYIANQKGVPLSELEPHIYTFEQEEAARHTFRVASGLDSMVLGETQIVGQMKKAEKLAREHHGLGVMLNHLFQATFTVAKEVRTATAIGANSVSLAAAAVRLALRLFGTLEGERVLFVGAGEMIELCAAHFAAQKPKSITIANRTMERGQTLARTVHADAIRLADLPDTIHEYDVIVSCTASALPIIGLGMIERDRAPGVGRALVNGMPYVLNAIGIIGTVAMLWVGGHLIVRGFDEVIGWHLPHDLIERGTELVGGGAAGWFVDTGISMLFGLAAGLIILGVVRAVKALTQR